MWLSMRNPCIVWTERGRSELIRAVFIGVRQSAPVQLPIAERQMGNSGPELAQNRRNVWGSSSYAYQGKGL